MGAGSVLRRLLVVGALACGLLGLAPASAGSTPAAPRTFPAGSCWLYVPQVVIVLPPSPIPGQTITLAGKSVPLETVTLTIGQTGRPPIITTTVVTNWLGLYVKSVSIPLSAPPGRYTVTVSSPYCGPAYAQFNVRYPDDRCADYREFGATRGVTTVWELLSVRRYNKPVKVTLVPEAGGTSRQIFNGTAPAFAFFTWYPAPSWPAGWYSVSEVATSARGISTITANCGRVHLG